LNEVRNGMPRYLSGHFFARTALAAVKQKSWGSEKGVLPPNKERKSERYSRPMRDERAEGKTPWPEAPAQSGAKAESPQVQIYFCCYNTK